MLIIQVQDKGVQAALELLQQRTGNMQPKLQTIGEDIMARAKARFGSSTGPDGQRWKPNAQSTVLALIERTSNKKGGMLKDGKTLSKKSRTALASKKVLVDTGSLASQFHVSASATGVTIGNTMKYAAIHQFGGQAGKGKKVTIPARPFLPVKKDGSLYPDERRLILEALNDYLAIVGLRHAD